MVHEGYAVTLEPETAPSAADSPHMPCCAQGCRYFAADGEAMNMNSPGKSWAI